MLNAQQANDRDRWRAAKIMGCVLGGLGAMLLALEIGLRIILGFGSSVLFITDVHYGYFPKKNQHVRRFFVHIDTNRFGMRSAPISEFKERGEYRILFVGDSVAFGTSYVDQKYIFSERIATYFRSVKGRHFTVLNASAPGWAPSNEFEYLKAKGLYAADMVVMVYNTNDLAQPFAAYQGPPLFPVKNPSTAIGELWSRYLEPRIFCIPPVVDPGSTSDEGRPSSANEARVMGTIESTRQLVSSKGARMVIIFSPAVSRDVRRNQADWDSALANLKKWAGRENVTILDMTRPMSTHPMASLYFDGIHLRPAGDQLIADSFIGRFGAELN